MKKLLVIAIKDLTLVFRDRAALIMMLLAPLVLTLGLGAVTGRLSGLKGDGGIRDIAVVLVNQDDGSLGRALVDTLQSVELDALLNVTVGDDPAAARSEIDADKAAVAIVIPAGFTASVIPPNLHMPGEAIRIALYGNPARPMTSAIVQSIVEEFLNRVETGRIAGVVTTEQLARSGRIALDQSTLTTFGREYGARLADTPLVLPVDLARQSAGTVAASFDPMASLAPGMALLFLMNTVTRGGATLLSEQRDGTLPRLRTTPTFAAHILGGKVLGIFLTALAQVAILIAASSLFFGLRWADTAALALLIPAVAFGATGWGVLIATTAHSPAQANNIGAALMLLFGVLGNSFGQNFPLPYWLQVIGQITPNLWGVQSFSRLAAGGTLTDIAPAIGALLLMGVVLFAISSARVTRIGLTR